LVQIYCPNGKNKSHEGISGTKTRFLTIFTGNFSAEGLSISLFLPDRF